MNLKERSNRLRHCESDNRLILCSERKLNCPAGRFNPLPHELVEMQIRERGSDVRKIVRLRSLAEEPGRIYTELSDLSCPAYSLRLGLCERDALSLGVTLPHDGSTDEQNRDE